MFAIRLSQWKHRQRKHPDQRKNIVGDDAVERSGLDKKNPVTVSLSGKRKHPDNTVQNVLSKRSQKSQARDSNKVKKILDVIMSPSKNVQDISLSPPKIVKTDEIESTDDEM